MLLVGPPVVLPIGVLMFELDSCSAIGGTVSGLEATGRKRPSLLLVTDGDRLSEELTTTLRVGDFAISRLLSLGWMGNLD